VRLKRVVVALVQKARQNQIAQHALDARNVHPKNERQVVYRHLSIMARRRSHDVDPRLEQIAGQFLHLRIVQNLIVETEPSPSHRHTFPAATAALCSSQAQRAGEP